MTKKEYVERNISLTFDFLRYVVDHPDIIDTITDGAELDFIDNIMPFKEKPAEDEKKIERYKINHIFEHIKG